MKNINEKWHRANKMPKNATFEQRIKWHKGHAKFCACRPIPNKLLVNLSKVKN